MSELSLKMTLTLLDSASPELKAFVGLIESLGPKVTGLSNRLHTLEKNIANVGDAASTSSTKIDKASQSLNKLNETSGVLEAKTGALVSIIETLSVALLSIRSAATLAAESINSIGAASRSAGSGVKTVTSDLDAMERKLTTTRDKAKSLNDVMLGMAAQWGARKIGEGLVANVDEASTYQQQQAKIAALNLPTGQQAEIEAGAAAASKRLGISINESLQAYSGALAGLSVTDLNDSRKIISATLDQAIKAAIILRLRGDASTPQDIVRNMYGLIEARGQTDRPEDAARTINIAQQVNAATQGKISLKDQETVMRQTKAGLGYDLNDDAYRYIMAFANQLKASGVGGGGGGGQGVSVAGTAVTQVAKIAQGGTHNKEAVKLLIASGLLNPSDAKYDSDTTSMNVTPGALKNAQLALSNPIQWLMSIAPTVMATITNPANKEVFFGNRDTKDPRAIDDALAKFARIMFQNVNVANAAVMSWTPGAASNLQASLKQQKGSKNNDEALADLEKTYARQMEVFSASVHNLAVNLGTVLLPILTPIVEGLTKIISTLADFSKANPALSAIAQFAAAFTALGLAIFALQKFFSLPISLLGALGKLFPGISTLILGLTSNLGAVGAKFAAFFTGMVEAAVASEAPLVMATGVLAKSFLRMIPFIGEAFMLYEAFDWVGGLEVQGVKIRDWVASFMDDIVTSFKNGWLKVKAFVGLITDAEAQAGIAQNNKEWQAGKDASGVGGSKPWNSSAGKIKRDDPVGREQALLDKMEREAAAVKGIKKYDPNAKTPKKTHGYDSQVGAFKQENVLLEDEIKRHKRELQRAFSDKQISISDYYDQDLKETTRLLQQEIDTLQKERARQLKVGDKAGADKTTTQITLKSRELKEAAEIAVAEKKKALEQLKKEAAKIDLEYLKLSGKDDTVAAIADVTDAGSKVSDNLRLNGMADAAQKNDDLTKLKISNLQYASAMERVKEITDARNAAEEQLNYSIKAGTITATEAANAQVEIVRKWGADVGPLLATAGQYATTTDQKRPVTQQALEAKAALTALSASSLEVKGILENAFTSFFTGLTSGVKSAKDLFKSFFQSIAQGVAGMIAKSWSQDIVKILFGGDKGGGLGAAVDKLFGNSTSGGRNESGLGPLGTFLTGLFGSGKGSSSSMGGGSCGTDSCSIASGIKGAMSSPDGGGGFVDNLKQSFSSGDGGGGFLSSLSKMFSAMMGGGGGSSGGFSLGGLFGGGGSSGGLFGGFGGGAAVDSSQWLNPGMGWDWVPSFDVGTDYVPKDMLAMIHKGEKITPAPYNKPDTNKFSQQVVQHINNNFDSPQSTETMSQIAASMGNAIQRAMQRNS